MLGSFYSNILVQPAFCLTELLEPRLCRQSEAGKMTALQLAAAMNEHTPCVESLIKAGADPSLTNEVSD